MAKPLALRHFVLPERKIDCHTSDLVWFSVGRVMLFLWLALQTYSWLLRSAEDLLQPWASFSICVWCGFCLCEVAREEDLSLLYKGNMISDFVLPRKTTKRKTSKFRLMVLEIQAILGVTLAWVEQLLSYGQEVDRKCLDSWAFSFLPLFCSAS